jgi:hypothetical protein
MWCTDIYAGKMSLHVKIHTKGREEGREGGKEEGIEGGSKEDVLDMGRMAYA